MVPLPKKGILAITAVIDIAINARGRPVAAKALAARHLLRPRHLEPVLQALMHHGILKGIRGQRGGYELARERHRITAEDIVRAADTVGPLRASLSRSPLLSDVVTPALAHAEDAFSAALARLTIADLARPCRLCGYVIRRFPRDGYRGARDPLGEAYL
jgi:Rrf2 family protein